MTVSSQQNEVPYVGDGVTVSFTIPFYFLQNSDINIIVSDSFSNIYPVTQNVDYTVSGAGNPAGGTVTFGIAPLVSRNVLIQRIVPATQLTDYQPNDDFPAETHERALDKLTMISQQQNTYLLNALVRPFGKQYYDAQGRNISNLAEPVLDADAATKGWAGRYFGDLIDGATGLINTTVGILYDSGTLFDYLRFGVSRMVDTVAELRQLTQARNQRAMTLGDLVKGDGGHGLWSWTAGNLSAQVAGDPASGVYVAPNSDLTGASGAWVRIRDLSRPSPEWWGRSAVPQSINSSTLPVSLQKNRVGATQDQWVMLFGDSHGWGQGAPDSQLYTTASNYSVHSANIHNKGFMRRISDDIEQRRGFFTCNFGNWSSTYPAIGQRPGFYPPDSVDRSFKDPNRTFPLIPVMGKVTGALTPLADIGALTDTRFYSPAAVTASYTFLFREKLSRGLFGLPMMTLGLEGWGEFQESGKTEYLQINVSPSRAASGAGFQTYLNPTGGVYAERNTTSQELYVCTIQKPAEIPFWLTAGSNVFLPGYGLVKVAFITTGGGGGGCTFNLQSTAGAPLGATGALLCLRDGMRLYHPAYVTKTVLKVPMQAPARVMYLNVRHKPAGGILNVYFTENIGASGYNTPYLTPATAQLTANAFEWAAGAVSGIVVAGPNGTLPTATKASVTATNYRIDTSSITAGVTEEVIYRIDFGATQMGDVFIEATGSCDTRGAIFDNNKVVNVSMGGHTVGAWLGEVASASDPATDHIAQILNHTPVQPSHVVTQIPFVNEYLQQTPIATFKTRLLTYINRFKNHIPTTLNFNAKGVDFIFFTTLRQRGVAWQGVASSPITYDMYVQAAKEFCAANNCAFIDVEAQLFTEVRAGNIDYQRLYSDDLHPSDYANELIYKEVKKTLDAVV